jgi:hypothetical protein
LLHQGLETLRLANCLSYSLSGWSLLLVLLPEDGEDGLIQLRGRIILPTNQAIFQMGDRVRLSELGASRMKEAPSKVGRVVGAGKASKLTIRVLFDGMKCPVSLHQSYLEPDEREPWTSPLPAPFADPEKAARRLMEHASAFVPIQEDRIHIEKINGPFLFEDKGTPAEYSAGLKLAIERSWLWLHESGTYLKITPAGAELFAWPAVLHLAQIRPRRKQ